MIHTSPDTLTPPASEPVKAFAKKPLLEEGNESEYTSRRENHSGTFYGDRYGIQLQRKIQLLVLQLQIHI